MNLESTPSKKAVKPSFNDDLSMDDFEFRPITSGLGFHQPKLEETKISMMEKVIPAPIQAPPISTNALNKDMNVYQNDLSIFYSQQSPAPVSLQVEEVKEEIYLRLASKTQRVFAYCLDILLVTSLVSLVLFVMAATIEMDIISIWQNYPNEITPLVVTLFCGFYLIYFSIFDKTASSTLGKNLLKIRVVGQSNEMLSFTTLFLRSFISLLNFVSLGLFSYFDLQNKVTSSKVVRTK
ncbi:MAG: RDD family protein [Bacteriovoracaceae bacterium]